MESNEQVEAREALESVARERAETARRFRVPPGYDELLGLAVTLMTLGLAFSNAIEQAFLSVAALILGMGLSAALLVLQVKRFRRMNGTAVSSLIRHRTLGVNVLLVLAQIGGIVAATAAARDGRIGWTIGIALVSGGLFALLSREWNRRYLAGLVR